MPQTPVPYDPTYTAIANGVTQDRLIAEQVMPIVQVGTRQFYYHEIPEDEQLIRPIRTKVGRKGTPEQMEFTQVRQTGEVSDHAIDIPVPDADRDARQNVPGFDPAARAVEMATKLLQLEKEIAAATFLFNSAIYNNAVTLAGTSQWSHADSDPIRAILEAMDTMVVRPTIAVMGREVSTQLSLNPAVRYAWNAARHGAGNTDAGIAQLPWLAELLGLEAVYVGEAWYNTAVPGQSVSRSRAWGKHCALLVRDEMVSADYATTFAAQFRFLALGNKYFAKVIRDEDMGAQGGNRYRTGESYVFTQISANHGYFFENAVA